MTVKILIACTILFGYVNESKAQNYVAVQHFRGTKKTGTNSVNVMSTGNTSSVTFNGVGRYHIGNKGHINGFDFSFEKEVRKLRIIFTAIEHGEKIEIGINGKRYNLNATDISPYESEYKNGLVAKTEEGLLTIAGKNAMASATIDIAPGYDITSVYVHHQNGLAAGAVFDLSFEDKALGTDDTHGNENNNGITGVNSGNEAYGLNIFPNPNTGSFTIKGNIPTDKETVLEIVNAAGQKVYEQRIQPVYGSVNESLKLDKGIANGIYMLYLDDGERIQSLRFTLNR